MDASQLTNITRQKVIYSYFISESNYQRQGCKNTFQLPAGQGISAIYPVINDVYVGAIYTTPEEEAEILENSQCSNTIITIEPLVPPSGLPQASLWFDPSDLANITIVSGNITAFTDKTGNGNNGVAYNNNPIAYNVAPINGKGTVRFDNAGGPVECLKVTNYNYNDTYLTYALIVNYRSGSNGFMGTDDPGKFGRGIGCYNGKATTISYNAFTTWDGTPSPDVNIPANIPTILVVTVSAGNWILSVNGTQYTLPLIQAKAPDNLSGFNMGCWNPTNYINIVFDMGEALVYKSFLTNSEIQKVEGYLATKWGLLANLPISHPYKGGYP